QLFVPGLSVGEVLRPDDEGRNIVGAGPVQDSGRGRIRADCQDLDSARSSGECVDDCLSEATGAGGQKNDAHATILTSAALLCARAASHRTRPAEAFVSRL